MAADPSSSPTRDGHPTFSAAEVVRGHNALRDALRAQFGETIVIRSDGLERLQRYPREMVICTN